MPLKSLKKRYLIIPSVPTPNGRLHLGHIGGPYLSADILARHVRRFGHQAHIMAGTDSYESYVTKRAEQEAKEPAEICHHYHRLIAEDLALLDIDIEEMVNPLEKQWDELYAHWQLMTLKALKKKKGTTLLEEKFLWNKDREQYQIGCRLHGHCPSCEADVAGYFCEKCGTHFRPEEVRVVPQESLILKAVKNLFMPVPFLKNLSQRGIYIDWVEKAYQSYWHQQKGLMRLTTHERWGIPVPAEYQLPDSTIFNYGLMFSYFLLMGERLGKINGSGTNGFAIDSDVITVATFGYDNAVPFLASIHGICGLLENYKPFDYYLVNYFYHLNGQKFSTSREHAIWAHDIINQTGASSDIVRLYLATIDVRNQTGNVDTKNFLAFYNVAIGQLEHALISSFHPEANKTDSFIWHLLSKQETYLDPQKFAPHRAAQLIMEALQFLENNSSPNRFWELKAFALLAYPFMPKIAGQLWHHLGYVGEPSLLDFFNLPERTLKPFRLNLKPLSEAKLSLSLPVRI